MSKSYDILEWVPVIAGCSDQPAPAFYVKPDLNFLQYIQAAGAYGTNLTNGTNQVRVLIANTNTLYDNTVYFATVDLSSNIPNCRPNFYDATNYYVLTLDAEWDGYPPSNGSFSFVDTPMINGEIGPSSAMKNMPVLSAMMASANEGFKLDKYVMPILLAVMLLIVIVLWRTGGKKK